MSLTQADTALRHEKIPRLLLRFALPAIVSMMVVALYNIADRIFIGQGVGSMAISGLALTLPVMSMLTAIGTLVGVGASSRISIVLGIGSVHWAQKILGNSLYMTLTLSLVFVSLAMYYLEPILLLFGGSQATLPYAMEYLHIVLPGSVFTNLTFSFASMMRASGYPTKSMIVTLIGAVLNVALDALFILVFGWGIAGAAYATVISMAVGSVFVMHHFVQRSVQVGFRRHGFKLEWRIVRNVLSIGISPFIMNLVASMIYIVMNNQLVRYGGDMAIGAYGIVNSYGMLFIMIVMGLCQGMQPIVGYNYGAGNLKRMKDALFLTLKVASLITGIGFAAGMFIPHIMASGFTQDTTLLQLTTPAIRIAFSMFFMVGFQVVVSNFFQSIGKVGLSIFQSLNRQVLLLIPLLYLLGSFWGLEGVWMALPVSDVLSAFLAFILLRWQLRRYYPRRRKVKKRL